MVHSLDGELENSVKKLAIDIFLKKGRFKNQEPINYK